MNKSQEEIREAGRIRMQKWRSENPYAHARRFGLTPEQLEALFDEQEGRCGICGGPPIAGRTLAIDHDHACCPGKRACGKCVRGLLCFKCNVLLGNASDDIEVLKKAIAYLERWM